MRHIPSVGLWKISSDGSGQERHLDFSMTVLMALTIGLVADRV